MQWSDETVERVKARITDNMMPGDWTVDDVAKAALAAVAECKEVRELVGAVENDALPFIGYLPSDAEPIKARLRKALAPFVEASCNK